MLCWSALAIVIPLVTPMVGAWDAAPEPTLRPLILDMTGWTDRTTTVNGDLPLPAAATGIGPGSPLLITMPGKRFGCTANFIWSGTDGKTYLGSAGHCFIPEGKIATHGPGADYDPAGTTVRVCVAECYFGHETSQTIGSVADDPPNDIIPGTFVTLGPVAYARGAGIGHDFGIVEIPSELTSLVRPTIPVWGGPVGTTTATSGKVLCHYGKGTVVGEVFLTMARLARATGSDGASFRMTAATSPGDSGSPVEECGVDADGIHGRGAVGIHTHSEKGGPLQPFGAILGIAAGTRIGQAATMATEAGLTISLVEAV